jgi:hypothetical protein
MRVFWRLALEAGLVLLLMLLTAYWLGELACIQIDEEPFF